MGTRGNVRGKVSDYVFLYRTEKSTDQVVKPVNTDSLTAWVGKLPQEVVRDMSKIAPMLAHLGKWLLLGFGTDQKDLQADFICRLRSRRESARLWKSGRFRAEENGRPA